MPKDDEAVNALYQEYKHKFDNPGSVTDFMQNSMLDNSPYVAVFLPGGHGAMLGLPENPEVGEIIRWSHQQGQHMLAICHGPAALIAANIGVENNEFIYNGYQMNAFPDAVDKQTPSIGYMPGHIPWRIGEALSNVGIATLNKKIKGDCHIDRELISGDSPLAANEFGRLSANALLKELSDKT